MYKDMPIMKLRTSLPSSVLRVITKVRPLIWTIPMSAHVTMLIQSELERTEQQITKISLIRSKSTRQLACRSKECQEASMQRELRATTAISMRRRLSLGEQLRSNAT